jgi:2-polyprenyl-3-methyl-5-hydroxy-6-metoxy-1,4-benzoquinol methylase
MNENGGKPKKSSSSSDGSGSDKQLDRREHWKQLYETADTTHVNWYQDSVSCSLDRIQDVAPDMTTSIIDVGGGGSILVDGLLDRGYTSISVLDIALPAIELSRNRLGERASLVNWIVADVCRFEPERTYEVWHDRAVFHFLLEPTDRKAYRDVARRAISPGGKLIISTFAIEGPFRCAGLDVRQYGSSEMADELGGDFLLERSETETHITPGGEEQLFWCGIFSRK